MFFNFFYVQILPKLINKKTAHKKDPSNLFSVWKPLICSLRASLPSVTWFAFNCIQIKLHSSDHSARESEKLFNSQPFSVMTQHQQTAQGSGARVREERKEEEQKKTSRMGFKTKDECVGRKTFNIVSFPKKHPTLDEKINNVLKTSTFAYARPSSGREWHFTFLRLSSSLISPSQVIHHQQLFYSFALTLSRMPK